MTPEQIAFLGMSGGILAFALGLTWKAASLSSQVLTEMKAARKKEDEQDVGIKLTSQIPDLARRVEQLEGAEADLSRTINHSVRPGLVDVQARMKSAEERLGSLKAMRTPWRQSRPDVEDDE